MLHTINIYGCLSVVFRADIKILSTISDLHMYGIAFKFTTTTKNLHTSMLKHITLKYFLAIQYNTVPVELSFTHIEIMSGKPNHFEI